MVHVHFHSLTLPPDLVTLRKTRVCFGIKDITVELGTPMIFVSVGLVDTKGNVLARAGGNTNRDSDFNFFNIGSTGWTLEYGWTINGRTQTAIIKLMLTKVNARFDSSTGKFDIRCNFVGDTWGPLSRIKFKDLLTKTEVHTLEDSKLFKLLIGTKKKVEEGETETDITFGNFVEAVLEETETYAADTWSTGQTYTFNKGVTYGIYGR